MSQLQEVNQYSSGDVQSFNQMIITKKAAFGVEKIEKNKKKKMNASCGMKSVKKLFPMKLFFGGKNKCKIIGMTRQKIQP